MPILNLVYAYILSIAAYTSVDFKKYTLLSTNESGYRFYLDESNNYIITSTINNEMGIYNKAMLGTDDVNWEPVFIGVTSADDEMIAGIHAGIVNRIPNSGQYETYCLIESVWVDEKYRHQGLASWLIENLEDYARKNDCSEIRTKVREIDQAHTFFEKTGFDSIVITPSPENVTGHAEFYMTKKINKNDSNKQAMMAPSFSDKGYQIYIGNPLYEGDLGTLFAVKKKIIAGLKNLVWSDQARKFADAIDAKLEDYRKSQGESQFENDFTIFIVSPDNKIVGGAMGEIENIPNFGTWCNIEVVAINENHRKHKLGTELLGQVKQYAEKKQCKYCELWTGEWQARGFYEKVGFTTMATFPKFLHPFNQEGYILRKTF